MIKDTVVGILVSDDVHRMLGDDTLAYCRFYGILQPSYFPKRDRKHNPFDLFIIFALIIVIRYVRK